MFIGRLSTTYIGIAVFTIAYLAITLLTQNSYYQLMLTLVPIWAVLGLSWNIFSGYSGLVSFGHAVFFGLGAYTTTLLLTYYDITPWVGIPVAAIVGSLSGVLIGSITFRLRGHYFALAMLAYPLAILYIFEWAGLQEVSLPMKRDDAITYMQFPDQRWAVVVALALLVVTMLVTVRLERSRFGLSLLSIKQNELAAEAAGINSLLWKLRAIAISGAFAGAAGGLYAVVLLVVTPNTVFSMPVSSQALIVSMFGGVGTVWGPVLGALVLVPVSEILHAQFGSGLPGIQGVVYGIAIILVIMKMPQGVVWSIRDRLVKKVVKPLLPLDTEAAGEIAKPAIGQPILEVRSLSKAFGGVKAATDVNIKVNKNEILGIIGPNGAGKTTLFNMLNGIVAADVGEIIFGGRNIRGQRSSSICKLGIGRTFQVVRPFPRMTLTENVMVGALVGTPDDEAAKASARAAVARLGLMPLADVPASELTNYELRLMELARALAPKPEIVLLDEPFAGLDTSEVGSLMNIIKRLRAEGLTIVIIEHTMQAMVRLVDRFVVLDHGVVIAEGEPGTIVKDPAVIRAYLGDKWMPHADA